MLGRKASLKNHPNADFIPVEQRLLQEKERLSMKKETMKRMKEMHDVAENTDKPFVRTNSITLGLMKSQTAKA